MFVWLTIILGLTLFVILQAGFWIVRAREAANVAQFFSRVLDEEMSAAILEPIARKRLAKGPAMQELLSGIAAARRLATLLSQAGLDGTVAGLLARILGAAVLGFLLGMALRIPLGAAFIFAVAAGFLPFVHVLFKRAQREQRVDAQLSNALEMLTLFLRAGRSLPQAFAATAKELTPPISEEFQVCTEEYRLGRPLEDALRGLLVRFPHNAGLRSFVMAVAVLSQTGGNLIEAIEGIRQSLRAEAQYVSRLNALTGESRMSAMLVALLPAVFFGISAVLNPTYFRLLFVSSLGQGLLLACVSLWLTGLVWLRLLLKARPL